MKVYYRDKSKVMRAIPGVTIHNSTIFINKSVYTLSRPPKKHHLEPMMSLLRNAGQISQSPLQALTQG